jgi:hypothetical protein
VCCLQHTPLNLAAADLLSAPSILPPILHK